MVWLGILRYDGIVSYHRASSERRVKKFAIGLRAPSDEMDVQLCNIWRNIWGGTLSRHLHGSALLPFSSNIVRLLIAKCPDAGKCPESEGSIACNRCEADESKWALLQLSVWCVLRHLLWTSAIHLRWLIPRWRPVPAPHPKESKNTESHLSHAESSKTNELWW